MKLTLVVEYDKDGMTLAEYISGVDELVEKAREYGNVIHAKLAEVPSEIDVS